MNSDQKNTIIAIVLSALVLIGWQLWYGPQMADRQKQAQQQTQQQPTTQPSTPQPGTQPGTGATPGTTPAPGTAPPVPPGAAPPAAPLTREAALATSPRLRIDTPSVTGSIALKGARIDDLSLVKYRETVDPHSPAIVLLAPSGSPHPYYAELGWTGAAGTGVKVPDAETPWQQQGSGTLGVGRPITLTWDNGEGLEFRRTIAIDENYLFTIEDAVANKGGAPVTLYPYALISRHGTPPTLGYYILHEGFIGVFGDKLSEESYANVEKAKQIAFSSANSWLGFTDKYWA